MSEERYYLDELKDQFPIEKVKHRKGPGGKQLAYIDARDVADRLDEVVGQAFWQNRYTCVNGVTVCEIGIKVDDESWIWKSDGAPETTIEAEKGALSDAFKRAAVKWGIARYLYDDAPPPPQEPQQEPKPGPPKPSPPASPSQKGFIKNLTDPKFRASYSKGALPPLSDEQIQELTREMEDSPSKADASRIIDRLTAQG